MASSPKRFILIAGLPSGGKTFLAKLLKEEFGGYIIDDPTDIKQLDEVPDHIDLVYITDPYFCLFCVRPLAEERIQERCPGSDIKWVFLTNDPDQCRKNVAARDDDREVKGLISYLSCNYKIPAGYVPIDCYSDENHYIFVGAAKQIMRYAK